MKIRALLHQIWKGYAVTDEPGHTCQCGWQPRLAREVDSLDRDGEQMCVVSWKIQAETSCTSLSDPSQPLCPFFLHFFLSCGLLLWLHSCLYFTATSSYIASFVLSLTYSANWVGCWLSCWRSMRTGYCLRISVQSPSLSPCFCCSVISPSTFYICFILKDWSLN